MSWQIKVTELRLTCEKIPGLAEIWPVSSIHSKSKRLDDEILFFLLHPQWRWDHLVVDDSPPSFKKFWIFRAFFISKWSNQEIIYLEAILTPFCSESRSGWPQTRGHCLTFFFVSWNLGMLILLNYRENLALLGHCHHHESQTWCWLGLEHMPRVSLMPWNWKKNNPHCS